MLIVFGAGLRTYELPQYDLPSVLATTFTYQKRSSVPTFWERRKALPASNPNGQRRLCDRDIFACASKQAVVLSPQAAQEAGVPPVLPRPEDTPQPPAPIPLTKMC